MIPFTSEQSRTPPTHGVLVHNPASRAAARRGRLDAAIAWAEHAGWSIRIVLTEAPGHATAIARDAAAAGGDVLIVSGGDGTIKEAINGIAGTETAPAVPPRGPANAW